MPKLRQQCRYWQLVVVHCLLLLPMPYHNCGHNVSIQPAAHLADVGMLVAHEELPSTGPNPRRPRASTSFIALDPFVWHGNHVPFGMPVISEYANHQRLTNLPT